MIAIHIGQGFLRYKKKKVVYVVQVLRILIQRFKGSHNYLKVGG